MHTPFIRNCFAAAALAGSLACKPALSQDLSIGDVLKGKSQPISISIKDLDSSWLVMVVTNASQPNYAESWETQSDTGPNVYFTQGKDIAVGKDTYLIAYQLEDAADIYTETDSDGPISASTKLTLALINTDAASSFSNVHPFNLQNFLAVGERAQYGVYMNHTADDDRLATIGKAVSAYVNDHGGKLPPLDSADSLRAALKSYISPELLSMVNHDLSYVPNQSLSGATVADIKDPDKIIVLYTPVADRCGCHHALFADGSSHEILPNDWEREKSLSGIN